MVAGHAFKAWISAVVQNKDGEGEGHGRCDERIGRESLVERERKREREVCQSGVAKQVWPRASLGAVPTRRQCVASVDCRGSCDGGGGGRGGAWVCRDVSCTSACGVVVVVAVAGPEHQVCPAVTSVVPDRRCERKAAVKLLSCSVTLI